MTIERIFGYRHSCAIRGCQWVGAWRIGSPAEQGNADQEYHTHLVLAHGAQPGRNA